MSNITKETRKESFEKIQLKRKSKLIYEQLGSGESFEVSWESEQEGKNT